MPFQLSALPPSPAPSRPPAIPPRGGQCARVRLREGDGCFARLVRPALTDLCWQGKGTTTALPHARPLELTRERPPSPSDTHSRPFPSRLFRRLRQPFHSHHVCLRQRLSVPARPVRGEGGLVWGRGRVRKRRGTRGRAEGLGTTPHHTTTHVRTRTHTHTPLTSPLSSSSPQLAGAGVGIGSGVAMMASAMAEAEATGGASFAAASPQEKKAAAAKAAPPAAGFAASGVSK